ncbi:MAG: SRPBCC family protein, partial [Bdellovibrionales bacterium]
MAQQAPHSEIPSRTISRGDVSATQNGDKSRHAVTIDRAPEEVYRFWRNFENLALFMKDVKEIISETPVLSQWKVELKSGRRIEWTAEITTEVPGKLISWSSLPD